MKLNLLNWREYLKEILEDFKATGSITESKDGTYIDAKEVGTIIRSLGLFPTEAMIAQYLTEMKVDADTNTVDSKAFMQVLERLITDSTLKKPDEEKIYRSFLALDKDQKGYLTKEELLSYMSMEGVGEPLNQEEMEELLAASLDTKDGKVYYEVNNHSFYPFICNYQEYIYNMVLENA